jgi:hypothetical protein
MRYLGLFRTFLPWRCAVSCLIAAVCAPAHAQVVISEFLASNALGQPDDDGDREDWIELHNPSGAPVNLRGWSLTDDAEDSGKWTFPEVYLEPGGLLVVYASGKDRSDADQPMHTNFRLGAEGEYLALVRPDGSIASAFAPEFPPQVPDVSYGAASSVESVRLLEEGAVARLFVPTTGELGTNWIWPEFNDQDWDEVVTAVGFDRSGVVPGLSSAIRTDIAGKLLGRSASAYLRVPFVVTDTDDLDGLELLLRYNDGFIAFLNGEPVAQRNAPVEAAGGVVADQVEDWSVSGDQGVKGWYYGLYDASADTDGAYEPVTDFDNLNAAWTWNGSGWVLGPGNPPWTAIARDTWHPNGGSNGANVQWAIRRWVSQTAGPVTVMLAGAKENTGCGSGVTFRLLINGEERFARAIAFDDAAGFMVSLPIEDLDFGDLVDFALDPTGTDGETADGCDGSTFAAQILQEQSAGPQWDSAALAARSHEEALAVEPISIEEARDRLVNGTNLLALQVLNVHASDPDLLFEPVLSARRTQVSSGPLRYFTAPTPGALNSGGAETLGPVIIATEAEPKVPRENQGLVIRAQVRPTLRPVSEVRLRYRVMFGNEVPLVMRDDGQGPDSAGNDGWWSVVIPAGAASAGQMIRWSITATDQDGASLRYPPYPDPRRSPQYLGTVIEDPTLGETRLPVLHWFVSNPGAADSDMGARGALFFDGEFYDNINANLHGQSTRGFPKKSYDFDFHPGHNFRWRRDQPRVDDFNLLTTWADKTHLRNVLAYETYEQAGVPAHFAMAVRVQLNGRFHSVANLVENGDDNFLSRLGLDEQGALYKMYNTADSTSGAEKKTRKNEGARDLADLIRGFTQGSTQVREAFLYDHLNVPEVINYLAARAITGDSDCCHKNYYLYRDTEGSGEWMAFPWDVDLSFGRAWTCNTPCYAYYDETIYTDNGLFVGQNNRVFSAVLTIPSTRQMYLRRVRTLMDELTQPPGVSPSQDRWLKRTIELRDAIAPDAALDLAKWGTWGRRETITQAVDRIHREFLPGRRQYLFVDRVRANLIPASQPANATVQIAAVQLAPAGGDPRHALITLTNAHSYAVDLSDWRLEGAVAFQFMPGTVIPARAVAHVTPDRRAFRNRAMSPKGGERRLVLGDYHGELSQHGGNLVLRDRAGRVVSERAFDGTPSASQQSLRITELMYHPPDGSAADAEFIELRNVGTAQLDLTGVRFTEGIEFDFSTGSIRTLAPGAHVIVVKDLSAFTGRYGGGLPVAGAFTGSLNNAGERLRLEDPSGEVILDFIYPANGLPPSDGLGFSLLFPSLSAPWTAWSDPGQWRVSSVAGGTPGAEDIVADRGGVVINEILTHSDPPGVDAIELHNPTSSPIAVADWWLTDDRLDPLKFRLPAGTVVSPGGFVVFDEGDFNAATLGDRGFALSRLGDEVWLFSGNPQGQLTGYSDGARFEAAASGVSFGRHANSAGEVRFTAQREVTLGRENAGPRIGPVVLTEIHFGPARGEVPFVEMKNITEVSVPLFDPTAPTNTWRLDGVDFSFPPGVSLPPGGIIVVVGGDPLDFKSHYGVAAEVLGPWDGALQEGGERLRLERPGSAEMLADGTAVVPRIVVEEVNYRYVAPWPLTASMGRGPSLERREPVTYGDEPASWQASPGRPSPGIDSGSNHPPIVSAGAGRQVAAEEYPLAVSLSGSVEDDGLPQDPGRVSLAWSQVAGPSGAEFVDVAFAQTSVLLPGPGRFVLRLTAYDGAASAMADVTIDVTRPGAHPVWVPAGSTWRYYDAGMEPAGWRSVGFDDGAWSAGPAQLGYGDGDEARTLRSTVNGSRVFTAYFRRNFVVDDAAALQSLKLSLMRDDGAAVWLNGIEAFRSNLPQGALTYATPAVQTVSGTDESLFFEQELSPQLLHSGTNLIAVEVHQQNPGSSDLSFDLALEGVAQPPNRAPTVFAGADQSVPILQVVRLAATWSDDGLPQPARLQWEQVSGPRAVVLNGTNSASPALSLPAIGAYEFRFTVSDGERSASDVVALAGTAGAGADFASWSAAHFSAADLADPDRSGETADPDQDGMSNFDEFRSGTLPKDPASVLRAGVALNPDGRVRLEIPVMAGRTYAVQWRPGVGSGAWRVLESVGAAAGDGTVMVWDPEPHVAGRTRFYRVITPAP